MTKQHTEEKTWEEEFEEKFPVITGAELWSKYDKDEIGGGHHYIHIRGLHDWLRKTLTSQKKALLQEDIKRIEGMMGLTSTPDFYVKLRDELRYNELVIQEKISDIALTQVIWKAKDSLLQDLLSQKQEELKEYE